MAKIELTVWHALIFLGAVVFATTFVVRMFDLQAKFVEILGAAIGVILITVGAFGAASHFNRPPSRKG